MTSPFLQRTELLEAVVSARRALAGRAPRILVTTSRNRMSGAARVTASLSRALMRLHGPEGVLMVQTDGPEFERPDWFPDDLRRFDLSALLQNLSDPDRQLALMDIVRGTGAGCMVNVNSRLTWDTMDNYGPSLADEMDVLSYLFCWDETPEGVAGGYPIQWLSRSVGAHHTLLTDSEFLARNIRERFGFSGELATNVRPLRSPVSGLPHGLRTKTSDRPRALWAGRLDVQKRPDLLVEIARRSPEIDIWAYGQAVIGDAHFDPTQADLPPNLMFKPPFDDVAEVMRQKFDVFLYTSQWDGLPHAVLEAGSAGLPVIAPDVGGVSEVIGPSTGWLIPEFDDVTAYCTAIEDILSSPEKAQERATSLRTLIASQFSTEQYAADIKDIFGKYAHVS